ncbi:MFS transporter [Botrimarina sp.]|uniref:MFS transporter n=1 Tax=Botrimarina sp. TaxID=2795802 RepID=UPI0032EC85BA
MESSPKLSVSEKLGYSLGDCAANFVFQTQLIFLMSFYTDVFGIAASTVGTIFLASRLFDAVNDPVMGALADRTNTRWGKYRPWVLLTAVPFAVFFVLAYTTPDLSPTGKVVWAFVTYNLLMIAYTANNIPYAALTGVLTGDPDERTSLVSWRFLLAMTAAFLVQTFTPDLVDWFGAERGGEAVDEARGYQLTMGLWATLAVVFFVVTFATTRERVQPDPAQQTSVLRDLSDLRKNSAWVALALCTVFVFVYLAMRGSVTPYYFDYYVAEKDPIGWGPLRLQPMGWFNGLGLLASMVGILFSKPLAVRFGKRNTFVGAIAVTGLLTAAFYALPPDSLPAIIGLQVVLQLAYGVSIPLLWAMMADVADYTEWKTRRRATAMTFAATVFALKLGLSLGGAAAGWILEGSGYTPNAETQTESAIGAIRMMMSVGPALAFLVAIVLLAFYRIGRVDELQMGEDLQARRALYGAQ